MPRQASAQISEDLFETFSEEREFSRNMQDAVNELIEVRSRPKLRLNDLGALPPNGLHGYRPQRGVSGHRP